MYVGTDLYNKTYLRHTETKKYHALSSMFLNKFRVADSEFDIHFLGYDKNLQFSQFGGFWAENYNFEFLPKFWKFL